MTENPIKKKAADLGINTSLLAWRAGFTHPTAFCIFSGKRPLTARVAEGFAKVLKSDALSLVIANALWRHSNGVKLTSYERMFITAGKEISGTLNFGAISQSALSVLDGEMVKN